MRFTFKKNNKQTKKHVNRFLQDDASAGMRSLQTPTADLYWNKTLPKSMERTLVILPNDKSLERMAVKW